jgi:oligoendopeptidase F
MTLLVDRRARESVPVEQTWNLAAIFASPEEWEYHLPLVENAMDILSSHQGRLATGPQALVACLQANDALTTVLDRVASYAFLASSADGAAPLSASILARAQALMARVAATRAAIETELLVLPTDIVSRYLRVEPRLEGYRVRLERLSRRREHILAPEAEQALAALSETLDLPVQIHTRVTAVDLYCAPVRDSLGRETPVSLANYVFGLDHSPDRTLRQAAAASLAEGLGRHQATLAAAMAAHIKRNVVLARLRGYPSAAAMMLEGQQMPEPVYRMVLETVHDEMAPLIRRLLRLKQRVLGLDRLYRYDIYAPLDPDYQPSTSFEDAAATIQRGLSALGSEYAWMLRAAFHDRWIDRADNAGKSSGAFCMPVHTAHPYVLMTWKDATRGMFTLAHELGHAGHGLFSARAQPIGSSLTMGEPGSFTNVSFFIEVPSTANEVLLVRHLLDTTADPRHRCAVIQAMLDTCMHNMVTHLLEAHFEQRLYDLAEAGEPLTLATIVEVQEAVFSRFFGETLEIDDAARLYWAQQPHFYSGLYPYTYAAGLACGFNAVEAMRAEGQPAVNRWLEALATGTTQPPLDIMLCLGVVMTGPEPIRRAVAFASSLVDELERSFA